jgi:hypothetical protein
MEEMPFRVVMYKALFIFTLYKLPLFIRKAMICFSF